MDIAYRIEMINNKFLWWNLIFSTFLIDPKYSGLIKISLFNFTDNHLDFQLFNQRFLKISCNWFVIF